HDSPGERFLTEDTTYTIPLSFISIHPGRYQQWLVMDFDIRPVLLKKLQVRVGQLSCDDPSEPTVNHGTTFQPAERWHRGNRVIIPCSSRTEEEEQLLNNYKPPQINFLFTSSSSDHKPLNKDNYRERMHRFLYDEEQAEDRLVSRLNVCGEVSTRDILSSPQSGMDVSPRGHLFCVVPTRCPLTVDSPEGQVLKRSVHCGLIAPSPSSGLKVYEASMLRTTENQMFLLLSKQCCSDLSLRADGLYRMEVQFQLDRHSFCTLHKAVDLLPDTRRVLPDLHNCAVPISDVLYEKLNTKQQSAVHFITGRSGAQQFVAPLLIYGPFGTGKTLTLATAARELIRQPHNKVLICTHTNSSADLYVRDHFHPFISGDNDSLKPLRIKANKHGTAVSATDKVTLKYCFRSEDGTSFLPPTKVALDRHNVVITTTMMARHVQELQLAEGFFSHILIDEASQMLECEALMALGLGGPNTRLVLAGDHMQMGPKLFSVEDDQRSHHTLLTRLFHLYQGQRCEAALSSRIIFSENYRSTAEIVHFVSTNFYVGKNDVIKASGNIPAPADGHALKFTHVRGECLLDKASMSWYNRQEVDAVIEAVKDVLERWPPTWGLKDQTSVCVLSEGVQVRRIRAALSKKSFSRVHVENLANVQGKQFRAVVMTAVQTRDSLNPSHLAGLELFNDARVLNTAMTRAQSQVLVVGDAAALCCFGKCSGIWKSFIDHCISSGSAAPQHFTKQFFERDVLETTRFQRPERVKETLTASDAILQELEDEYEQLKEKYSCDEEESEDQNQNRSRASHADGGVSELLRKQPHNFQQGTMFRESHKRGYVVPFHDPSRHIAIKGRENLGKAFTGDQVVLQTARVVNITRKEESARVLVCQLEDEDHSKPRRPNCNSKFIKRTMIPLTRTEPKIRILIHKRRRHFLPIWRQVEGRWEFEGEERLKENLRLNYVFMVQVISWKETCFYPLGYVLRVLPVAASLMSGLQILNEEFKVTHNTRRSDKAASLTDEDEDEALRLDLRDVITFTVDPNGAEDLDDAISVREDGNRYELGVHIADVASFVSPDGELDRKAKQRGSSFYPGRHRPVHMFPQDLSTGHFSLRAGAERRVVSLMFTVDKDTQRVVEAPTFQLSLITSDWQLTYEEAEVFISDRYQQGRRFESVPDCVTAAYCFAKAQRKARLVDWAYAQPDDDRVAGKRKAHLMIEELSILFNKHASETLIDSPKTRYHTPLRCQAPPERLQEFQENCGDLIPLSFYLRHRFHHDNQSPSCETFRVLTEVWRDIQSAARAGDTDKMVDLVAADDLHPLLQPVMEQFRRCYSKAYVTRSKSGHKAEVGHYSLNLPSYTYASSPIRRYMDIILQRLLHAVIRDGSVHYSRTDISTLCSQFEQTFKRTREYEQKAEQMSYAVSVKKQSASKLAFVVGVEPEGDGFSVSFPFNKNIFPVSLSVMYKDLQLEDQPVYDKEHRSICLRWRRRIYAADAMQIHQQLKLMSNRGPFSEIPLTTWRAIVEAIDGDKLDNAKSLILEAKPKQLERPTAAPESPAVPVGPTESSEEQSKHWVDIQHPLQPGDTLHMQMTSEVRRGYHVPAVQLLHIKPKFEICVEHVHSPITCFSTSADDPTRIQYSDTQEYIRIWKPLCDMESAATAVDESDGIIIENLVVAFSQVQEGMLTGSFFLPVEWTERWAIECDLAKCFLCIRRRGLKLSPTLEHSTAVDPPMFTWVAHCVTTTAQPRDQNGHQVNFFVRHLAMETIPECVFQRNTRFTVEIIPKLLPNIRKESAVVNITSACELVQSVALGQRIPREVQAEWRGVRGELDGLPNLNPSQHRAVDKALHSTFTLIQGPPGTGKTVVGVHIVFRFFQQNSQNLRKVSDPKDKNKQQVILYCGPSNKSVDVVAEYLMRFKDRLRPLRVYSQQVEMLDYPFPDPTLQFSQRTLRQDRSKQELRSITLHHRMRQDHNIFSEPIKAFDERIKLAQEKKGPQLMASEVKIYKKLLRDAREFELRQHDIILCTCTQASTPSLTKTVSARQILIDECAMATEPQAMIPLVCNKPEKIVLIGDHKQLRPIVRNERVKKLGMAKSLFERYYTMHESRAVMLETQYRMHEDICEFPSNEFYDGKLETGVQQPASVLRVDGRTVSIVFGNVKGKTVSLVVSTNKGNENSKANQEERDRVVAVAQQLVQTANIDQQSIVILSPYNAQVSEIRDELKKKKLNNVGVNTITKSQV
ncbi:3'-5' exoribonuclease HELZ2, partial [Brachyistius frenatus]|uniref:3'-5' exoribonuclease HELZ2 n=1 Tax=Brachyistius frenatus TaxID=100188 RepID=UPI0037E800C0